MPGLRLRLPERVSPAVREVHARHEHLYAILGGSGYLDQRFDECNAGVLVISAITLGELEVGFARSADPNLGRSL